MLLSIVIPAYDRPQPLLQAVETFARQIIGRYEDSVEIIVTDDASPGNSLAPVAEFAARHDFITFRRREKNLGLERSLIACAEEARGEFLWIFGDDDYLETEDGLEEIIARLKAGRHDMLILNRTRRNTDLSKLLTPNWMRIDPVDTSYGGLREFCLDFGFISVIGFISVNIMRRAAFLAIDSAPYFGTMYPQLGMMLEAFGNRPVLLVGKPLVCHRTQTQEEKRAALGAKSSEADFMADAERRNALYFSHPYVHMLDRLVDAGAFRREDIARIPENTVINGLLVQFLIDCLDKSLAYPDSFSDADWERSVRFLASLGLGEDHKQQLARIAAERFGAVRGDALMSQNADKPAVAKVSAGAPGAEVHTISVVSPSFNQAEFLDECLTSVANQTFKPIEHLVYDPGSTDGSRDVARKYNHITLFEEPDEGQSDAINKGFRAARGDVIAWLNSDDVFADETVFERVMARFNAPDRPDIVYGKGIFIDEDGSKLRDVYINKKPETLPWRLQQEDGILQPALFMRHSVFERVGELNGGLHYCMDYEYWIRTIKAGIKWAYVDENFALARYHSSNKTWGQRGKSYAEVCDMLVNHFGYANHNWLRRYAEFLGEGFDGVLAHAHNTAVGDEAEVERHYLELMKAYNTPMPTYQLLTSKASEKGHGDTLRELKQMGLGPSTPCHEIPLDRASEPGHVCYTVGPKRWAFEAAWKKRQIERSHAFLRERIGERKGDVCVIVGNGPSLKKSNLDLLAGHDVIISNNAFLDPKIMERATYYTVVNYLVAEQSAHNINRLAGIPKVLPYWTSYCLNEGPDTYFMDAVGHAAFSKDMFKNMSWRHTVTFYNLHLAFGLGFKRVVMIGFDHFYNQSKDVKEGDIILSDKDDPNHFDSRYFKGKKWQAADVDMMEEMYRLAKAAFEEEGREIINATAGGALELFPRMDLEAALRGDMAPANHGQTPLPVPPASVGAVANGAAGKPNGVVGKPNGAAGKPFIHEPIDPFPGHDREVKAGVDETEVVARLLSSRKGPSHVMLDVGAHFGTSAGYFDNLGWTIHCFEPDPKNRERLVAKLGKRKNVTIDTRAVSDVPAKGLQFFTSQESTGISGLHSFRETHACTGVVDATTVAEIVRDRGLETVDFLKIDVEGFDFAVLRGVPWDRLRPDVIEAEFEDAKTLKLGHTYREICEYLRERGYAVYLSEWHPIVRYGIAHDWHRVIAYPSALSSKDAWGNILAFREDPGLDNLRAAFAECVELRGNLDRNRKPVQAQTAAGVATVAGLAGTPAAPAAGRANGSDGVADARPGGAGQGAGATNTAPSRAAPRGIPSPAPRVRRGASNEPLYTRFALWAQKRSPLVFAVGQFAMWCVRTAKRYALLVLLLIAALAACIYVVVTPAFAAFSSLAAWIAGALGGLVVLGTVLGYVRHLVRKSQDELRIQLDRQKRALDKSDAIAALTRRLQAAEGVSREVADVRQQLSRFRTQLAQSNPGREEVRSLKAGNVSMLTRLDQLERSASLVATEIEGVSRLANALKKSSAEELAAQSEKLGDLVGRLEKLENEAQEVGRKLSGEVAELTGRVMARDGEVTSLVEHIKAKDGEIASLVDMQTRLGKIMPPQNLAGYQVFPRTVSADDAKLLASKWGRALSVSVNEKAIFYMADKAVALESRLNGRLATSIQTIILRTIVGMGVNRERLNICEIGTLFGIGAAIMHTTLAPKFKAGVRTTLIDPLDGYYSAGSLDLLTNQPVDEATLRRNMSLAGIPSDEYALCKHFSTDEEALALAAEPRFDVLIIDGDHSYSGVKADFENYARAIRLGGFIIFDDYDTEDWPDIKQYVDEEVASRSWLAPVGADFRTSVFRVTRQVASADQKGD